jgi:hypothetical protein
MKIAVALFTVAMATASSISHAAGDAAPKPFHATYQALRAGEALGETTLDLTDNHDGTWTLRSETKGTAGLAKIAGIHIVETSRFRWHDGKPEAIEYDYKQDSAIKSRTRHAMFDHGNVSVEEGGKSYRYAIVPGLIDRQAVTLAISEDLRRGAKTFDYQVAVMDHVESMRYENAGSEKITVPAGSFDAVRVQRVGDAGDDRKRVARSWFAPKLGYVPVQLEQADKKDVITLKLVSVK